ncbi:conjugal transfer protein TraH [Photobacterium leiognathi]|uniref:conjugal transfer protein TraH n=1 Tax=Photobacterium leiognathi TaxID=553611 RepID=UPI00298141F5|nr:conjugal transfer protein TraH [Photobacterium leiognathi]
MRYKKTALISLWVASALTSTSSQADSISNQMDNAFGALVNSTSPAAYDSARRGVISGGQLYIRNPQKNANLVSFVPPSINAGCGGIDIFGGSFSFINADQFIENFQAIGANALGYGVKLAITSACDTCENVMTSLEKTAQFINKMNVDSCTAAQGIVDAGVDLALSSKADAKAKTAGVEKGFFDDLSEAWNWSNEESTTPTEKVINDDPASAKLFKGNVAWRTFKKDNINTLWGGDNKFLEMLMSITGTIVLDQKDGKDVSTTEYSGYRIKLEDLIADTTSKPIKIYKCDTTSTDGCLKMTPTPTQNFSDKGLEKRISDAYSAMIHAVNTNSEWSSEAKKALSIRVGTGAICLNQIRNALSHGEDGTGQAYYIAEICSSRVALETAYVTVLNYIHSVRNSLRNAEQESGNGAAKEAMLNILADSLNSYKREYDALDKQLPLDGIMSQLNAYSSLNSTADTIRK